MPALPPIIPVHAEAARYTATLLCAGELWTGPELWRPFAGYLAHRGWEAGLVDLREVGGGIAGRAAILAAHASGLAAPPVLVGHGAGALAVLGAAMGGRAAAVVLLAPLPPRSPALRALLTRWGTLWAVAFGRPVPPPEARAAVLALDELPAATRAGVERSLAAEHPAVVRELVRGRGARWRDRRRASPPPRCRPVAPLRPRMGAVRGGRPPLARAAPGRRAPRALRRGDGGTRRRRS